MISVDISEDERVLSWLVDSTNVVVDVEGRVKQVVQVDSLIVVLVERSGIGFICVYSLGGEVVHQIAPPENSVFMYLLFYSSAGICVVCGGDEKVDGWYDWHCKLHLDKGYIERLSPFY